jgi:hypothetical protein
MSLRKKEFLVMLVLGVCDALLVLFAGYFKECKGIVVADSPSFIIVMLVVLMANLAYLMFLSNEGTYFSLSAEARKAVQHAGKVMKIEDVKVDEKYSGVNEYDVSLSQYDVKKTLVMSNGEKFLVQESHYIKPSKETKLTIEKF